MKSKKLIFLNNSVLYAEHLNKIYENFTEYNTFIFTNLMKNSYGVFYIFIDQLSLSTGKLIIHKAHGIFSNGVIFDYDSSKDQYNLEFDLNQLSEELINQKKKFYLCINEEEIIEEVSLMTESSEIIKLNYSFNKLYINHRSQQYSLPIVEIAVKGGSFNTTDFQPPVINITKQTALFNELNKLIIFLRKTLLDLKEQIAIDDYNREEKKFIIKCISECLIDLNICIINEVSSFSFYQTLCSSIGKLAWKEALIPNIPIYNHDNSFYILNNLINLIQEIAASSKGTFNIVEFQLFNNIFKALMPKAYLDSLLIVISPNNEEIKDWIINTIIGSENKFEDLHIQRSPGISREIIDQSNNELVIQLDKLDPQLNPGDNLCVLSNKNLKINSIKMYYNLSSENNSYKNK